MRRGLALALGVWLAGCGETGAPGAEQPPAPLAVRGAVVVEPPRLALGETATVEVAVVTPPQHRVRPVEAPERLPGLWILGAETLPVDRSPHRWLHRTRFLVRARETGRFEWPGAPVLVEGPSGQATELSLEPRPLEVTELRAELRERREPFGLRLPPAPRAPSGLLIPALAGAGATLAALGLAALVRRARRRPRGRPVTTASPLPDADEIHRQLEAAERQLGSDPVAAADQAARALRRFLAGHFRLSAAATTDELAALRPPRRLGAQWQPLVDALRELDAVRFRPPGPDASAAAAGALAGARRWAQRAAPRRRG